MGSSRRKKRRTHRPQESIDAAQNVPKSFVVKRGQVSPSMKQLTKDFRQIMMPLTAKKLKERDTNSLKDFISIAGPLGVSHLVAFSHPVSGAVLRLAKFPRGPTMYFHIQEYSLCSDVAKLQRKPRSLGHELLQSPLLVLNNVNGQKHIELVATMFQSLFPAIDAETINLNVSRRVLLVNYDSENDAFEIRHYVTKVTDGGLSKGIKKLLVKKQLPDLSGYHDIADFVTAPDLSDSEAEDPSAARVQMPMDVRSTASAGSNRSGEPKQASVRLTEVGPRLKVQLVKIEEGFANGEVIYHKYIEKSAEEVAALRERKQREIKLKEQRKKEQAANVNKKKRQASGGNNDGDQDGDDNEDGNNKDGNVSDDYDYDYDRGGEDEMDDADWYRKEVGEEPEEGSFSTSSAKRPRQDKKEKSVPWFVKRRQKDKDGKQKDNQRRHSFSSSSSKRVSFQRHRK